MATVYEMPQLGQTMEEGEILQWYVREGDRVEPGDRLLEIQTDKVAIDEEATVGGFVRKLLAPAGALVPVNAPIAVFAETADEPIDDILARLGQESAPPAASLPSAPTDRPEAPPETAGAAPSAGDRAAASPRARRAAAAEGVPLERLAGQGSGPGGRVLERDVRALLDRPGETAAPAPRVTPLAERIAGQVGLDPREVAPASGGRVRSGDVLRAAGRATEPEYEVVPLSGMRKVIAENMAKSVFSAPHVTLHLEADMSAMKTVRERLLPRLEERAGVRLSYTDLLVKAVAATLTDHPALNAHLVGDEIRRFRTAHVGVAVALDEGLIVPVVRDADRKGLGAISTELKALVEKARAGRLTPDDYTGGTFSITNLGALGIGAFNPVINPPQVAILGVGAIEEKIVPVDGQPGVRPMMTLSLSFDHRALDGAPAARFLSALRQALEHPELLLV